MKHTTLEYGINVHVRLLIFGKFSHLYGLIPYCTFINFSQSPKNIKITLILPKMFMYNGQKKDRTGDKFSESKFFEAFFQIFPLLFRALSEKNCQYRQFFGKSLKSWQKCEYLHQKECFFYFSIEGGYFQIISAHSHLYVYSILHVYCF